MISPWFVAYYILSILAIIANLIVLYHIVRDRLWYSETNQLVLYLHITSMILTMATQPNIYLGNESICEMMRFFHYYGGLTNVCVLCGLTYVYYNFMFNRARANEIVEKYAVVFVFFFPLIALHPFTTNAYDSDSADWCVLDIYNLELQIWALTVFYFWAILAIVICAATFSYIFVYTMQRDILTSQRLFLSIGVYIVIGWLTLLPRCIDHLVLLVSYSETVNWIQFITLGPIPLGGILYAFVFFSNYQSYRTYSSQHASSVESRKMLSLQNFSFRFSSSFLSFRSNSSKVQKDLIDAATTPTNQHNLSEPVTSISQVKNPIQDAE